MRNYYKKSSLISEKKKPSTFIKVLKSPLTYSTLLLFAVGGIYANEQNKETPKNEYAVLTEKIHKNVENVYGLSKFNMVTFEGV